VLDFDVDEVVLELEEEDFELDIEDTFDVVELEEIVVHGGSATAWLKSYTSK
jgi:hypothetical protein